MRTFTLEFLQKSPNDVSTESLLLALIPLSAKCLYTNVDWDTKKELGVLMTELRRRLKYYEDATTRPHSEVPRASDPITGRGEVDYWGDDYWEE